MSYKVIPTCIKWNSFSLALNNGHKILLAAAVGLMLNSHWDRCLCLALGEYIYCLPCCHISAFSAFNSLFFYFIFFLFSKCLLMFWSCFDFIFFQSLGAFWLVWDFESVPPNLCICSNPKRLISAVQLRVALWCLRNLWKVKSCPEIHHLKHCIQNPHDWYHGFSWPWDECLI